MVLRWGSLFLEIRCFSGTTFFKWVVIVRLGVGNVAVEVMDIIWAELSPVLLTYCDGHVCACASEWLVINNLVT